MLTIRDREEDKIKALDAGADDYIIKPFSMPELAARIRSAVRRSFTPPLDTNAPIVIGEIELDRERRTVLKGGMEMRLTNKEFELLHYLMSHPGVPLAHAKLLRAVWGAEYGQELEYLRVFMHQLRKKLEDDPSSPEYLLTELHFGYRFREPAEDKSASNQ
jgi:two-component system KDP operon response regulator KdpE